MTSTIPTMLAEIPLIPTIIIGSFILVLAFGIAAGKKATEERMNISNFTCSKHVTDLIYSSIGLIILPLFALWSLEVFEGEITFPFLISSLWLLYFLFSFISYCRYRITVKDEQITYTPFIGLKKSFPVSYITRATRSEAVIESFMAKRPVDCILVYHENKKLFSITGKCTNFKLFISFLETAGFRLGKGGDYLDIL